MAKKTKKLEDLEQIQQRPAVAADSTRRSYNQNLNGGGPLPPTERARRTKPIELADN